MDERNNACIVIISPYAPSLVGFRGPLIKELVRRGVKVYVMAPDYSPNIQEAVRALGAKPVSYPLNRTGLNLFQDLWSAFSLWRLFRRLKPNIVLSYAIKPVIYGTLAAWTASVPRRVALITGLGYTFVEKKHGSLKQSMMKLIVTRLYRTALNRAHLVFFQNPNDLKELTTQGIADLEKAVLMGATGVVLDEWPLAPPVLNPVTFTLAARLLREKGIVEFAEAARIIKKKYPQTRFILLGGLDTNPGASRQEEIEGWVKEGIIEWPGQVPDVQPYLSQTSVYVLPSYYREGMPRSIQEAMAMGRAVITTDVPGCRETVIDGVNGFLVPPRDPVSLAKAMERFIQEPELIERMGKESRRLAKERFDATKINQRFIAYLFGKQEPWWRPAH